METIAASARGLPERPFLLLGQQTVADPTRAPVGKHTAWAYTHGPRDSVGWASELDRHVDRMEAQVERYAPGFRDLILARHVLGPAALQDRNANLINGDVGGGTYRLDQVIFRPAPSLSPYRTPLRGRDPGARARRFPAARSTVCVATPPPTPRWRMRAGGGARSARRARPLIAAAQGSVSRAAPPW